GAGWRRPAGAGRGVVVLGRAGPRPPLGGMRVTTLGAEVGTLSVPGVRARRRIRRSGIGLAALLLAPTLLFLLVFTYWPLVVSVLGSFQRFTRMGTAPPSVGRQHYQ